MKSQLLLTIILLSILTNKLTAQQFVNGGLEGPIGFSVAPTGWQRIPYTDTICLATNISGYDSPDITGATGPSWDIIGFPYEGNSFLSGLFLSYTDAYGNYVWHEGIQQELTGLNIGQSYSINFHQAVVKQGDCLDESGAWSVYMDDNLIGVSALSYNLLSPYDTTLVWEQRTMIFQATATTHLIKFIPFDDDPIQESSTTDIQGGLRMGIDAIYIDCSVEVDLGEDTIICQGDSLILSAGLSSLNFIWNDGSTDSSFTVNSPGLYWVEVTSGNCIARDSIQITFQEPQVDFTGTINGCTPVTAIFTATSQDSINIWEWDFGNGNSGTGINSIQTYSTEGNYSVSLTVTDIQGCSTTETKDDFIIVYPTPSANIEYSPSVGILAHTDVDFWTDLTNNENAIWVFNEVDYFTSDFISYHFSNEGNYTVQLSIENEFGCTDSTEIIIEVTSPSTIYLPNSFTPDGDEYNNIFKAEGEGITSFQMQIFNRWGELLFESYDMNTGWDGTYHGRIVEQGTYIWKLVYALDNSTEKKVLQGHINLLR